MEDGSRGVTKNPNVIFWGVGGGGAGVEGKCIFLFLTN